MPTPYNTLLNTNTERCIDTRARPCAHVRAQQNTQKPIPVLRTPGRLHVTCLSCTHFVQRRFCCVFSPQQQKQQEQQQVVL